MPPPGQTQRATSKFIVFEHFEKMNTQSVRQALSEKELAWLENLQPIAPNNLTTVPAPLPALTNISETISSQFYANLGTVDYIISFTTVGSGWATNVATAASIRFAPPGTFIAPDATVWQSSVLLMDDIKAGYCAWNGTVFVQQGGVSMQIKNLIGGTGFTSIPAVTITGGSGTGATAVATIGTPQVAAVNVITGGSQYGPAPSVVFAGGGGTGAAATANIDPRGITSITVTTPGLYPFGGVPQVQFGPAGGVGAVAAANMVNAPFSGQSVTGVTITNPGFYAGTPLVIFSGGGGSGAAGLPIMASVPGGLEVVGVQITAGGSGYSSPPGVTFAGGFPTFQALGNATISNLPQLYQVGSISILNPGSNYTGTPSVSLTGGSPITGAAAICTVGNGAVLSITLTSGGSGYTSAPTVSFSGGGGGSGATAAAIIGGSSVTSVTLTNPGGGYLASDVLTVNFSGGGGTGASATANVWPFVTKGTTLAIFQGRVWLGSTRILQYTGTAGFDDFSSANASATLTISDADLVHGITALRSYNNSLFIVGDQSIKQIGNISLNAAGTLTLFTILTISSDQGSVFLRSCGSFDRVFMFANTNGIYAVLGSSVQKISDDLDGIFKLIDFSQQPQAAVADMNNIHHILYLVRYKDPVAGTRSIMLAFNGKKWFVVSQGDAIATITSEYTAGSDHNNAFVSSGTDITQILGSSTTPVKFTVRTALTHHGNAVQQKQVLREGAATTLTLKGSIGLTVDTDLMTRNYTPSLPAGFQAYTWTADGSGRYLGATMTGTLAGFTLTNITLEYQETAVGNASIPA